jgi:hypothetical protein
MMQIIYALLGHLMVKKISFSSNREGGENFEVYDIDADDGSDVTRLTEDDADDGEPDWGTNTSTPDDDKDKNKHDSKKSIMMTMQKRNNIFLCTCEKY